jgi:hypothetical protein
MRYKVTLILDFDNIVIVIVTVAFILIIPIITFYFMMMILIIAHMTMAKFLLYILVRTVRDWVRFGRRVTCQQGLPWPCSAWVL